MTTTEVMKLQDVIMAVADELQLATDDNVSVSQVTVTITYSMEHQNHQDDQDDFIDDWYKSYLDRLDAEGIEVPF